MEVRAEAGIQLRSYYNSPDKRCGALDQNGSSER